MPLASWIFLLALLGYMAYAISVSKRGQSTYKQAWHQLIYRKRSTTIDKERDESLVQSNGAASHARSIKYPKTTTFFAILYSLLIIATLLMSESLSGYRLLHKLRRNFPTDTCQNLVLSTMNRHPRDCSTLSRRSRCRSFAF